MHVKCLSLLCVAILMASPAMAAEFQVAAIAAGGGNRTDASDKTDALEQEEGAPAPRRSKVLDAPPSMPKRMRQPDPYPAMLKALLRAHKALWYAGVDPNQHLDRARMHARDAVLEIHGLMGNPEPLSIAQDDPPLQPLVEPKRRVALKELAAAVALLNGTSAGGEHREAALRHLKKAIEEAGLAH